MWYLITHSGPRHRVTVMKHVIALVAIRTIVTLLADNMFIPRDFVKPIKCVDGQHRPLDSLGSLQKSRPRSQECRPRYLSLAGNVIQT